MRLLKAFLIVVVGLFLQINLNGAGYFGVLGNQVFAKINGTTFQMNGSPIILAGSGPYILEQVFVQSEKWTNGGTSNVCGGNISWSVSGGGSGGGNLSYNSSFSEYQSGNNTVQEWVSTLNVNLGTNQSSFNFTLDVQLSGSTTSYDQCNETFNKSFNRILPVEIVTFSAMRQDKKVLLQWETSFESNLSHFVIERSDNGINWEEIGITEKLNYRTNHNFYQFTDENPIMYAAYYRLMDVDLDNKFFYSKVLHISAEKTNNNFSLYPNPLVGETLSIDWKNEREDVICIAIYGINGNEISQYHFNAVKGSNIFNLNTSAWPLGLLFYKITDKKGNLLSSKSFLKM